mmetsp:Transcript_12959/g.27970  ORF Transcript_12959/g.27970 Transcript_12959/m.27970 type:complete len:338 (+) Transcript_12959:341-1354(+)
MLMYESPLPAPNAFILNYFSANKSELGWGYTIDQKTDYIVDGMGVYVTRNKDTYLHGQMELTDNIAYGNGINGVVFHRTDRGVVKRNTVYNNGVIPRLEYSELPAEDWMVDLKKSRQPYSGIVINNAEGVKLWSNNVMARYDDDYAYNLEVDGSGPPPPLAAGGNNKVCRGLVDEYIGGVVWPATDTTVCGVPSPPATTPAPSTSPTKSPVAVPTTGAPTEPAKYVEISCGGACHLIQWPYDMGNAYAPNVAHAACELDCDLGVCKAFSLQDDYRPNMVGMMRCFLYREDGEPSPEVCANDPFNRADGGTCAYATSNGQFFITPEAKEMYNVYNLEE